MPHNSENTQATTADIYTKAAFYAEFRRILIEVFSLGKTFDLAVGLDKELLGLSYYGWAFGILLAATTVTATAHCQKTLNDAPGIPATQGDHQPGISAIFQLIYHSHLSRLNKAKLLGATIDKALDVAVDFYVAVKMIADDSKTLKALLTKEVSLALNLIFMLIGLLCAIAPLRIFAHAILAQHTPDNTVAPQPTDTPTEDDRVDSWKTVLSDSNDAFEIPLALITEPLQAGSTPSLAPAINGTPTNPPESYSIQVEEAPQATDAPANVSNKLWRYVETLRAYASWRPTLWRNNTTTSSESTYGSLENTLDP